MNRVLSAVFLVVVLAIGACSSRPVRVLHSAPGGAYRTLGMLSGQGPNEATAMGSVIDQAERMEADAVIVVNQRPLGQTIIISARAIRYLGPPPPPPGQ